MTLTFATYVFTYPWVLTIAFFAIAGGVIGAMIWSWQLRADKIAALYTDPDPETRCIYLDNGTLRLDIIRRRAAWRFRVKPLLGLLQVEDIAIVTLRPDGSSETFTFEKRGRDFLSITKVHLPHVFVAHLSVGHERSREFVVSFGGDRASSGLHDVARRSKAKPGPED
ncbi:hypothetical protein [Caulobacter sp.]|jgi:hypothetical protein|uniref:hypothetical protein n=1 Tax=Caulobacter sp. TaxID=78 RepID=UPI0016225E34